MISIIGILAAVAIPAYNTYKVDASNGVIESSVNVVSTALRTCLALKNVDDCRTVANIKVDDTGDIDIDENTVPTTPDSTNPATKVCYDITLDGATANGCADYTGKKVFCAWAGTTAVSGKADCAAGVCQSGDSSNCSNL